MSGAVRAPTRGAMDAMHTPHFMTRAALARLDPRYVLGAVSLGELAGSAWPFPHAPLDMPPLDGEPRVEVWTSPQVVRYGQRGELRYAANDDALFELLEMPVAADFEAQVRDAYEQLLSGARALGFPHFLRIWNYFPDMHSTCGVLDRYRVFCRGRHAALTSVLGDFDALLPAASAVGTRAGGLLIYALASRTPGRPHENPRQTPAYQYPPEYGPKSPSFARATLAPNSASLYISGTASIVGHASRHADDLGAQLEETLTNLAELITHTDAEEGTHFGGLTSITHAKVYLRSHAGIEAVRSRIASAFGTHCQTLYLLGEICRPELLVEIEAIATAT